MLLHVTDNCGMVLAIERDNIAKCVQRMNTTTLSGKSYFLQVMSDGTAVAGSYESNGNYREVLSSTINEIFNLKGSSKLWEGRVIVDGQPGYVSEKVVNSFNYDLDAMYNSMKNKSVSQI